MDNTQAVVELLAHQNIALGASVVGGDVNVATMLCGTAYIYHANIDTTANLGAGLSVIELQVSPDASGLNWADVIKLVPSTTASVGYVVDDTSAAGQPILSLTTTPDVQISGQLVYIKDETSVATSEWAEASTYVHDDTMTMVDNLAVQKVANDDLYTGAARWAVFVDFSGVQRIRVVVHHKSATGAANWRVYACLAELTDFE